MTDIRTKVLSEYAHNNKDLPEQDLIIGLWNRCDDMSIDESERTELINEVLQEFRIPEEDSNLFTEMLNASHILVAGTTGCGKSVLINGFINEIINTNGMACMFYMCDPKRVELSMYKKLPQCIAYSSNGDGMIKVLRDAVQLVEDRFKYMSKRGLKTYTGTPAYVIIDEFADLMTTNRKQALPLCQRLAQVGRASNVHLIVASQDTTKKTLDTVKNNLTCKIALRTATRQDSVNILGFKGAEDLPRYGKCIYSNGIDTKILNVPYVTDEELAETINRYASKVTLLDLLANKRY